MTYIESLVKFNSRSQYSPRRIFDALPLSTRREGKSPIYRAWGESKMKNFNKNNCNINFKQSLNPSFIFLLFYFLFVHMPNRTIHHEF